MPGIYDTNNGYYQFVDKARAFACGIYRNVPGALVPNPSDAGYKQIWDNLCYTPPPAESPGLPPPPAVQFSGGQCQCALYEITVRFGLSSYPEYVGRQSRRVYGAISGLSYGVLGREQAIDVSCYGYESEGCLPNLVSRRVYSQGNYPDVQFTNSVIESVVRVGGNDNCGDPPKKFPPELPPPPEGYNSPPVIIIQNDGDINYYIFNFSPPQKEDYPDTSFPPIVVSGTGQDNSSYLEMKFNFDGSVDIDKPPLPEVKLPESIQKKIDDTNSIVGGGGALEIKQIFDVDPAVKKRDTGTISEVEEDESGLLGIKVTLTNIPDKTHFGAPSVYFAGWITFKLQNGYAPRQQINFIESFFLAPPGATGYGCTFTNKAEGIVKVYSREAK